MTLLALDLGTSLGFAMSTDGVVISGTNDYHPRRHESSSMRFLKFQRWLKEVHAANPVTEVVYEEVHSHKGTAAGHIYGGFLAVLTAWCEDQNIPYEGVPVSHIKKFATGNSQAKKGAVIAAVTEKWGFHPSTDDEADALALLHLRLRNLLN